MDGVGAFEERIVFSPDIPAAVNVLLQAAVLASRCDATEAERLFIEALRLDGHCLETYFALYKFYFYQERLADAERAALAGLEEAARQGRFPADYKRLLRDKDKWNLYANEITHFYLYSLKALAFIKLRGGKTLEARLILSAIHELDPEDRSGASVIADLASALDED